MWLHNPDTMMHIYIIIEMFDKYHRKLEPQKLYTDKCTKQCKFYFDTQENNKVKNYVWIQFARFICKILKKFPKVDQNVEKFEKF